MTDAWIVLRAALRDTWDDLWTMAVCNLLWLLMLVFLVPGPPATVALFYYANRLAHGEVAGVSDFWQAFRRYFVVGWRWGLLNGIMLFLLVGDITIIGRLGDSAVWGLLQGLFVASLLIWLLFQLYLLAFLFEQEEPSLQLALRNGAVMLGDNIVFSVALGLMLGCVLLIGTLAFMLSMAAGGVFVALVGNHAVLNRLAAHGKRKG